MAAEKDKFWQQVTVKVDKSSRHSTPLPFQAGCFSLPKLILEAIIKQVEEKKVIRSSQHGFTKGKSCLTNLIAFYNGMSVWIDDGRAVHVVYLDFSKAVDTVSHNILLGKLRKCGLDEN